MKDELNKKLLSKLGFKHNEPHFESYPLHPYWVKDGVILLYNKLDERNIFLIGYAEMRMGKYYAVGIRWIESFAELKNIFYALRNSNLT